MSLRQFAPPIFVGGLEFCIFGWDVFNLRTDSEDHILGFTSRWLNELALYYEQIDVLTTHQGTLALANNIQVYSTGRERGLGRVQQTINFYNIADL